MMCTSELFDPSSESDFKERSIQVRNQSMLSVGEPKKAKSNLSVVIPTIFQHHVTFRNLSEGKGTVRLNRPKEIINSSTRPHSFKAIEIDEENH